MILSSENRGNTVFVKTSGGNEQQHKYPRLSTPNKNGTISHLHVLFYILLSLAFFTERTALWPFPAFSLCCPLFWFMTQLNWYWCSLENRKFGHYSYRLVRTLLCGIELYCMLYRACAVSNTVFYCRPMHLSAGLSRRKNILAIYGIYCISSCKMSSDVFLLTYWELYLKKKTLGYGRMGASLVSCSYCAINTRVEGTQFRENNQVHAISCLRFQKQIISLSL